MYNKIFELSMQKKFINNRKIKKIVMTLFSPIQQLIQQYQQPFFSRASYASSNLFLQQQLSQWIHQIYYQKKRLHELSVIHLVQNPIQSIKPNIACSIMYSIIRDKVQQVCKQMRELVLMAFRKLVKKKTSNTDLKHQTDSWNINFIKYTKHQQNNTNCLPQVYGPIAHIITNFHNSLLDSNKEVYDLWKLLYQCSEIKDLQFKTLQSSLNELILDQLMQDFPQNQIVPRQIMPTISSVEKHQFIFKQMWGFQKRKAIVQFNSKSQDTLPSNDKCQLKKPAQKKATTSKRAQQYHLQKQVGNPTPTKQHDINPTQSSQFCQQSQQQKQSLRQRVLAQQIQLIQLQQQIQSMDQETKQNIRLHLRSYYSSAELMKSNQIKEESFSKITKILIGSLMSDNQKQTIQSKLTQEKINQIQSKHKTHQHATNNITHSNHTKNTNTLNREKDYHEVNYLVNQTNQQKKSKKNQQKPSQQTKTIKIKNQHLKNLLQSQAQLFDPQQDQQDNRFFIQQHQHNQQQDQLIDDHQFMIQLEKIKGSLFRSNKHQYSKSDDQLFQQNNSILLEVKEKYQRLNQNLDKLNIQCDPIKASFKLKSKQPNTYTRTITVTSSDQLPNLIPIKKKKINIDIDQLENNQLYQKLEQQLRKQQFYKRHGDDKKAQIQREQALLTQSLIKKKSYQKQKLIAESLTGRKPLPASLLSKRSQKQIVDQIYQIAKQKQKRQQSDIKVTYRKVQVQSDLKHSIHISQGSGSFSTDKDLSLNWLSTLNGHKYHLQQDKTQDRLIDQPQDMTQQKKKKKKKKKKNKKSQISTQIIRQETDSENDQPSKLDSFSQFRKKALMSQQFDFNRMFKRTENVQIQDFLDGTQNIEKIKQQELLMDRKIQIYQKSGLDKKSSNKQKPNKDLFNDQQMKLFKFLESLEIKDDNREKCVVSQDTLDKIISKRCLIKNNQLFTPKKQTQKITNEGEKQDNSQSKLNEEKAKAKNTKNRNKKKKK